MTQARVIETNNELQGELIAKEYNNIMRESRDKGHLYTEEEIKKVLLKTKLTEFEISVNPFSLIIKGVTK